MRHTFWSCLIRCINIDLIQRVQNHAARLITGNFNYINCRGIELVKSLNLYTIRDRRDYFLTILMFKSIHGIAPTYLSDRVVMNFDVNGYDTRTSDMELYLPTLRKEAYRNSFMYMGGKLWNDLPEFVQNSANIESFKRNYKMSKLLMNSWLIQQFLRLFLRFVRFLCDEMIVPYVLSSSLYNLMWMDICISYCIYHTELCFSF